MAKLNILAMNKLIENCTSTEIDLMIYLTNIANEFGSARDLYYKDICLELGISKQSFYNSLYSLENKKIILIDNFSKAFNIQIIDNIYSNKKDYSKGYVNIGMDFLRDNTFRKLKLNVKRIILMILRGYKKKKNGYVVSINKIAKRLNLKKKWLINGYLENIKEWFKVEEINGIVSFKMFNHLSSSRGSREKHFIYKLKNFCRRYKINYTTESLKDTIKLFRMFINSKKNKFLNSFDSLIRYKSLEPKLINFIVNNNGFKKDCMEFDKITSYTEVQEYLRLQRKFSKL